MDWDRFSKFWDRHRFSRFWDLNWDRFFKILRLSLRLQIQDKIPRNLKKPQRLFGIWSNFGIGIEIEFENFRDWDSSFRNLGLGFGLFCRPLILTILYSLKKDLLGYFVLNPKLEFINTEGLINAVERYPVYSLPGS